jgi:hypothetical protein
MIWWFHQPIDAISARIANLPCRCQPARQRDLASESLSSQLVSGIESSTFRRFSGSQFTQRHLRWLLALRSSKSSSSKLVCLAASELQLFLPITGPNHGRLTEGFLLGQTSRLLAVSSMPYSGWLACSQIGALRYDSTVMGPLSRFQPSVLWLTPDGVSQHNHVV